MQAPPTQEQIVDCKVDVEVQSQVSDRSLFKPIQEAMINDMENVRPMEDICNLADVFEGMHCAPPMQRDVTDVPVEEIRPCCAYWSIENVVPAQMIYSMFCGFPSCIGIVGQCTCVCCLCKYVNCKLLDCKDEDSKCCALYQCNWFLTAPNKGLELQQQWCCLDRRAAGPCCTKKVPCAGGVCGLMCCADWKCIGVKCMPRLGDVVPRLDERVGKSPAAGAEA